jgi:hypothetical protein
VDRIRAPSPAVLRAIPVEALSEGDAPAAAHQGRGPGTDVIVGTAMLGGYLEWQFADQWGWPAPAAVLAAVAGAGLVSRARSS